MAITPGPWIVKDDLGGSLNIVKEGDGEVCVIATVWLDDDLEDNVRLIAAAPKLLEALKMIESVYRLNCIAVGEPSSVLDALQSAIANAEGK